MKYLFLYMLLFFQLAANQEKIPKSSIDPARLKEVIGYLQNAKFDLEQGLIFLENLPQASREEFMLELIEKVVKASDENNELLMRYFLRKTLLTYEAIGPNIDNYSSSRNIFMQRMLAENIKRSLKLIEEDRVILNHSDYLVSKLKPIEFASLGMEWTQSMLDHYYNLPSSQAMLSVMKQTLGFLYNEILDDSIYKRSLAPIAEQIQFFQSQIEKIPEATSIEKLKKSSLIYDFLIKELELANRYLTELKNEISNKQKELELAKEREQEEIRKKEREIQAAEKAKRDAIQSAAEAKIREKRLAEEKVKEEKLYQDLKNRAPEFIVDGFRVDLISYGQSNANCRNHGTSFLSLEPGIDLQSLSKAYGIPKTYDIRIKNGESDRDMCLRSFNNGWTIEEIYKKLEVIFVFAKIFNRIPSDKHESLTAYTKEHCDVTKRVASFWGSDRLSDYQCAQLPYEEIRSVYFQGSCINLTNSRYLSHICKEASSVYFPATD